MASQTSDRWLLSFDASARDLTVALKKGDTEFSQVFSPEKAEDPSLPKKMKQASRQESVSLLIPTIDQLLSCAGIKKSDLQVLCVGIGPGGFTGVRVAVVTARTLSQIMKLPLVPLNSLEVAAMECFLEQAELASVTVLKSASRSHIYLASYDRDLKELYAPAYLPLEKGIAEACRLCQGALLKVDQSLVSHFSEQNIAIDSAPVKNIAQIQAKLADLRVSLNGLDPYFSYESCQPLYLRGASVTLKSGDAIERIESH